MLSFNCNIKVTFKEAHDHCKAEGMRLCNTPKELNQCCGTECGYDNKLVWSSVKEGKMSIVLISRNK